MKINGSLVFDASSASEIQNLRVQKVASNPTHLGAADQGRFIYNTSEGTLYVGSGSAWVALATGGNAAALQTEVDALETSLGTIVNSSGVWQINQVTVNGTPSTASSLTALLQEISNYASGKDQLSELLDVTITAAAAGDFLRHNGTAWVDSTISLSTDLGITASTTEINRLVGAVFTAADLNKLAAVTADATELNILDGATLSTIELNYVDGVTSPIQTQLNGLQAGDPTLTALAALNGDAGIVVQTDVDTFTKRTLVEPIAGFTITNPAGTAGNPTFALANDLAALEGLATIGYIVRTADGSATTRSLSVNAGELVITGAANGVASDTTFGLATVTDAATGTFLKITRDTFGRVSGTTPVLTSDITALADSTYVNVAGDTMTGNLNMGGLGGPFTVTGLAAPSNASDATTKSYVDNLVAGLTWEAPVLAMYATLAALDAAVPAPATGARYALEDAPARIVQWSGSAWVAENLIDGAAFFNSTSDTGMVYNGTAIVPFTGGGSLVAGDGLVMSGNTVNINFGAGISQLPTDEVGIHLTSPSSGGLRLRLAGVDSTDSGASLSLVLKAAGGLTQDVDGLFIPAAGVVNAMLANSQFTLNGDSGTDALVLGDTLQIRGTSLQGISTATSESPAGTSTVTITAANASSSQKGVASFTATEFVVTDGNVALGTIANIKLANSTFGITGTTGSDQVALGQTLNFADGGTHDFGTNAAAVLSTVTDNNIAFSLREATTSLKGVASFDSAHFSVTAGAVSLAATLDDLTNVAGADTAVTGDLLTKTAGNWAPVTRVDLAGTIKLGDLQDVGTAAPTTAGQVLVADGTAWQAKKIFHVEDVTVAATSWTVTHNIGTRYCNVTVVDDTHNVVIPQSIVFDSTTSLTVTFNTAIIGKVVVMGIA